MMPGDIETFLTCKFKLHHPSRRRQALLDDVMRKSHLAFDKLLRSVKADVASIEALSDRAEIRRAKVSLEKRLRALALPLPLGSGPKQAVIFDAFAQIESYLELRKKDQGEAATSYPAPARLDARPETEIEKALALLAGSTSIDEENASRDALALARHAGAVRPLNIIKNRVKDGALLLKDEKGRLFAFVNLLRAADAHAREVDLAGLIDTRTGKVMQEKTRTGVLFPLACGAWHFDRFLRRATLQSSRITKENDDYYFAATFKFSAPERETSTYLGVDRGIEALAAWAVVDGAGKPIDADLFSGEPLRRVQRREYRTQKEAQRRGRRYSGQTRRAVADEEVHKAANAIVAKAGEHDARVVIEDLSRIANNPAMKRPKGARRGGFRHMLTRAQYQKLKHVLDYKLRLAGFAPLGRKGPFIEVHPAFTSQTCAACGFQDRQSRISQSEFRCTQCKFEANADLNAAANIASKGIHFDNIVRGRTKGRKLQEGERWQEWRRSHAGAGRESVLVRASGVSDRSRITEPGSGCGGGGSKAHARKSVGAGSPADAPHAKTSAYDQAYRNENSDLLDISCGGPQKPG